MSSHLEIWKPSGRELLTLSGPRVTVGKASANLVSQTTVDSLTRIYRAYRAAIHHRSLEDLPPVVADSEFTAQRQEVIAIWNATMPAS